jgi:hypothetical protein
VIGSGIALADRGVHTLRASRTTGSCTRSPGRSDPAQPLPTIGSPRAARPKSSGGWFAAALGAADPVTPGVIVPRAQGGRDHIGEVL